MSIPQDVLNRTYLALIAFAPLYPALCIVNDLSGGEGYYNLIPQIVLPEEYRIHNSRTPWPGFDNVVCDCVTEDGECEPEPEPDPETAPEIHP